MLIDDGSSCARTATGSDRRADRGPVPPTIQALLAARLDRLADGGAAVLERAAVEGKVFHRGAVVEAGVRPRGRVSRRASQRSSARS